MRKQCPICGKLMVEPTGPKNARILLVGEYPGEEEVKQGLPFVGRTGEILRAELIKAKVPYAACRVTNLWLHAKDEKNCDPAVHLNALVQEMKGREFVLMMGSDLAEAFFNCGIMDVSGLEMKDTSFPKTRIFMSVNPAAVIHEPHGELRLAIERFAEVINV